MNLEQLNAEVRKRYPIGTQFYPAHVNKLSSDKPHTVIGYGSINLRFAHAEVRIREIGDNPWQPVLWDKNRGWAEIVVQATTPIDPRLEKVEEAKKRYPVGTKFHVAHFAKGLECVYTVAGNWRLENPVNTHNDCVICDVVEPKTFAPVLYYVKNWAEIMSDPAPAPTSPPFKYEVGQMVKWLGNKGWASEKEIGETASPPLSNRPITKRITKNGRNWYASSCHVNGCYHAEDAIEPVDQHKPTTPKPTAVSPFIPYYVHGVYYGTHYILRKNNHNTYDYWLNIASGAFGKNGDCTMAKDWVLSTPTAEETDWMDACIKANKSVSNPKSKPMVIPPTISWNGLINTYDGGSVAAVPFPNTPTPHKYKVGEWVKIVNGGSGAYGCSGMGGIIVKDEKITDGSTTGGVSVKMSSGRVWGLGTGYVLQLADAPQVDNSKKSLDKTELYYHTPVNITKTKTKHKITIL